ncbi:MAG TPA: class II aldolase/adducin family protein [Candidatus Marinimicrobia bacterium]|nr:class II aldolase/adducin family protein [Candidatus Neomarinimicrobiota bacterium]HRS51669.1 class II aldolase/adducin family protein [Candidatus Neomarinimicrobiota bacterium]HRU92181.1 class II aldolase/adducin family protein [Candidatus Neomarinimicrobiota bacterium]
MTGERKYRKLICEFGKKIYANGYVAANDGNLSIRLNSETILITPTNVSKGVVKPSQIAKIDLSGNKLDNNCPSSESLLHLAIYKRCDWVKAVIHSHPPYATAWAVIGRGLTDPILPETIVSVGQIPLIPYKPPSTQDLADIVADAAQKNDVLLLQNHGLVAVGKDLLDAYYKTERAEHVFRIMALAKLLGEIKPLSKEEVEELYRLFDVPEKLRVTC